MPKIDVSASNITGLGATRLVQSLLPALERNMAVRRIILPQQGPLSRYERTAAGPPPTIYRRRLPNAVSRWLECTANSGKVASDLPILVLGDLPVRTSAEQVVLLHQAHIASGKWTNPANLKTRFLRLLFRLNSKYVTRLVVQTEVMKALVEKNYPDLIGRVVVIGQPAQSWINDAARNRLPRKPGDKLRLFYPAAGYPHKNHSILYSWANSGSVPSFVQSVTVTIPAAPDVRDSNIIFAGELTLEAMKRQYLLSDALIFPSTAESLGLPLLEAMFLGLPVVCADLPYARLLCGDQGIYFDPNDTASLTAAVNELWRRLEAGWAPDWRTSLARFPESWDEVAIRFSNLFGTLARRL